MGKYKRKKDKLFKHFQQSKREERGTIGGEMSQDGYIKAFNLRKDNLMVSDLKRM